MARPPSPPGAGHANEDHANVPGPLPPDNAPPGAPDVTLPPEQANIAETGISHLPDWFVV
jgi:hypothetical protein